MLRAYLRELKDPEEIARHDRRYLFYPIWSSASQSGFAHDDRIRLDRAKSDPRGSQRFRIYEDLSDPKVSAVMQLKAVGLDGGEKIEILINGTPIPDKYIHKRGAAGQNEWLGKKLSAFVQYTINLDRQGEAGPLVNGENELAVELTPKEGNSEGTVTIDDLEVYVYVRR